MQKFGRTAAGARVPKYPVPAYLAVKTSQPDYDVWLNNKSANLLRKDRRRKRPCSRGATLTMYKGHVHKAVCSGNGLDPYTGDPVRWDQIHEWNSEIDKGRGGFEKQFYMLPTVDHKDPLSTVIDFEICSWLVNSCKSDQTPEEFLAMCKLVTAYSTPPSTVLQPCRSDAVNRQLPVPELVEGSTSQPLSVPQLYFLPSYLTGIITEAMFKKWLFKRAYELHARDIRQGRPYAVPGARVLYKKGIYTAAINAGLLDPYTGERMAWEKINTWLSTKGKNWPDDLIKSFYLMPTVDHVDPASLVLEFQICTWRINECKSGLTPQEFVDVCRRVKE
jgi:hypothetical protein